MVLLKKPFEQRLKFAQFSPYDGCTEGKCVPDSDFAEEFALAVGIFGIRKIFFRIVAAFATEHTIGAEVDQATLPSFAPPSEFVRQKRIDLNVRDGGFTVSTLFDHSNTVDNDLRTELGKKLLKMAEIPNIQVPDNVPTVEQSSSLQTWIRRRAAHRAPTIRNKALKCLKDFVAEHARATQNKDIHLRMPADGDVSRLQVFPVQKDGIAVRDATILDIIIIIHAPAFKQLERPAAAL
jgi:hypothetical protein